MHSVQIENLRKVFEVTHWSGLRRNRRTVTAVEDISFCIPAGEAVAFIGPNGSGKSTTLKMLTGIMHPTWGTARVLGHTPWADRQRLALSIGAVFGQRSQLWYHLPPTDTFDLIARIYGLRRSAYLAVRNELVERFGLGSFMDTPVRKLSLGQRMRAEVAASLLHEPKVLFLDEPTIGLDVMAKQELRDLLRAWNRQRGMTIVLTSHDAGDIEAVGSRVIIIHGGRIVLDDSVTAVRRSYLETRVLKASFHEHPAWTGMPGVRVRDCGPHELQLEVNTSITPVAVAVARLLGCGSVADIVVEETPLDEVIARIFSGGAP